MRNSYLYVWNISPRYDRWVSPTLDIELSHGDDWGLWDRFRNKEIEISENQSAPVSALDILAMIVGAIITLFIPGFIWSYVFFSQTRRVTDENDKEIDILERIAISVGLSLVLVPLTLFILNYIIDIRIDLVSTLGVLLVVVVTGLFMIQWRHPEVIRGLMERVGAFVKR